MADKSPQRALTIKGKINHYLVIHSGLSSIQGARVNTVDNCSKMNSYLILRGPLRTIHIVTYLWYTMGASPVFTSK